MLLLFLLLLLDFSAGLIFYEVCLSLYAGADIGNADACAVYFSDFGSDGSLDSETMRRINEAAGLWHRGKVQSVICVGGNRPGIGLNGSFLMKAALEALGVENIITETNSFDTVSNADAVVEIMAAEGRESVVMVSSPVHLARISRLFSRANSGLKVGLRSYGMDDCNPPVGLFERIYFANHEFLAYISRAILPGRIYNHLVRAVRRQ